MRSLVLTSALLLGAMFADAQTVPQQPQNPPSAQLPAEPGAQTAPGATRTQLPPERPEAQKPEEPAPPSASETQSNAANSAPVTLEGCLNGSSGTFLLTDESRGTFQLLGAKQQLSREVGHTVQVTGIPSNVASAQTPSVSAKPDQTENETTEAKNPPADSGQQVLRVSKVKVLSKTCNDVPQR